MICKGKIKLTLLLPIRKIIPNDALHLSSESLIVSHQVHENNISRHKQKKESVILPQYLISLRVITSSEGGNFSSRTLCLSLQCKMLALLLGLMWNSSHLSATVRKDNVLKRLIKVFKLSDSNWTTSWPATKSVNQGVSGGRNWKYLVSTIDTIRLEPGNSKRRIRGNG